MATSRGRSRGRVGVGLEKSRGDEIRRIVSREGRKAVGMEKYSP